MVLEVVLVVLEVVLEVLDLSWRSWRSFYRAEGPKELHTPRTGPY